MRIGAVIVRVVASALLVGSGVLSIAAAYQRWWPACKPFDFEQQNCLKVQGNQYDYVMPDSPWVPVGNSASLAAVGLFLLGLAVLVVPLLMGRRNRLLTWSLCVAMSFIVLFAAADTWASREGVPAMLPGDSAVFLFWFLGWPEALLALAVLSVLTVSLRQTLWRLLVFGCLAFSSPYVAYSGMVMLYPSDDTPPWTGAVTGLALIVAGFALWPAFARPAAGDEDLPVSSMAGPAGELEHVAPS